MSVAKKDASAASVSGGAVGSCASTYACSVFVGIVETRACSASGVGGNAGFGEERAGGEAICAAGPLEAASDGEGVRSCWGTESTTISSDCFGDVGCCCCLREKKENIASGDSERQTKKIRELGRQNLVIIKPRAAAHDPLPEFQLHVQRLCTACINACSARGSPAVH